MSRTRSLTALHAMLELRDELKDFVTLQIVAFPQEGIQSFPDGEDLMRRAAGMGVDVIGAIPHFEFTREYSVDSLELRVQPGGGVRSARRCALRRDRR